MATYKTVKDVAEELGVTPRRVRQLIEQGRIEGAVKVGRDWMIESRTQVAPAGGPGDSPLPHGETGGG